MKLYIIGNGFDLSHNLKTRYSDFKLFLEEQGSIESKDFVDKLDSVFDENELWKDFEKILGELDVDDIFNKFECYLQPMDENWKDQYWHDFTYEVSRYMDFTNDIDKWLIKWINNINISEESKKMFDLKSEDLYLSFNYTKTLEELYNIDGQSVLHIHGMINSVDEELILGHNNKYEMAMRGEEVDIRVQEFYSIMEEYFNATFKPTQELIAKHEYFFKSLDKVTEIIVIGHSLSDVDMPYFEKIKDSVCLVDWTITCFEKSDMLWARRQLEKLKIIDYRIICSDTLYEYKN